MSEYCLRVFRGRARLHHPLLADAGVRESKAASLARLDGVADVRQGPSSILLLLKPEADLAAIRRALEAAVPQPAEAKQETSCRTRKGIGVRRFELRVLLLSCIACGALGAAGRAGAHVLAGAIAGGLLVHHVWQRRTAL